MTTQPHTSLRRRPGALALALSLAASYCAWLPAQAAPTAPTAPQVVAGQATFNQQGNVFTITNTPGAIINWQSFNIGAGEIARFIQQSGDSAVLNRVLGQDPTRILGALQSNGKVFLINPNGILFGKEARVDVNGLVASTLDIADADFKAGKRNFQAGLTAGTVRNDGTIATPAGGKVFLLAPNVENNGLISAPNGDVVLAAGHSVQLADSNDPDLHVVISAPADQALNLGQVIAQGGRVGIVGALLSQRGVVNADSAVRGADGKIVLKASRSARLGAGSVTSAAGLGPAAGGGEIRVLGPQIAIEGGARVDASGALGGGSVLVGGDWQGAAGVPRAQQVTMAAGASIRADATVAGNGGKVVLWSDGATAAHGGISVRGAGNEETAGNGGQVETSGHLLDVDGIAVDARAGAGARARAGTWLLDPYDIDVVAGGTAAARDVASPSGGAATGVTRIAPATLAAAGADVVLQAQHDLTVTDAIAATGSVHAQAGHDINVNAQVSAGGDLDFRAGNAFALGANGVLQTANYIDIQANTASLAGGIAGSSGAGGQLPVLSFSSADPARAITVGSGNADAGALWLDAATLGRLSRNAFEINLGNSRHTGPVGVAASLALASSLVMESTGKVLVGGAVDLSAKPDSRFIASLYGDAGLIDVEGALKTSTSILLQGDRVKIGAPLTSASVSLMPNNAGTAISVGGAGKDSGFSIGQDALARINAGELVIGGLAGGYGGLSVDGAVALNGAGSPARLLLDAGAGGLAIKALLNTGGTVALSSTLGVAESDGGRIAAPSVAVRGGQVTLSGANAIGTLAGKGDSLFQVSNAGALAIGSVDGLNGIAAGKDTVRIDAAGITGSGVIQANSLALNSSGGIGTAGSPLKTQTGALQATNQGSGNQPINIANQGALLLLGATQDGDANQGAIAIDSAGGVTVPVYSAGLEGAPARGDVHTGGGDISLVAHSPLTILGRVASASGNLRLVADNGGKLTIADGAIVRAGTGEVSITAGSTSIAAGAVQVSSPDKLHVLDASAPAQPAQPSQPSEPSQPSQPSTPDKPADPGNPPPPPTPPTPPTVQACLADHSAAGCGDVLDKAVQACVLNADGPLCGDVLPRLNVCQASPSTPGCGVVLARNDVDQCLANPALPGCGAKVPSYGVCQATPSAYGCGTVIQRHDAVSACIADPKAPACGTTLPALAACRADASVYGCVPVLARADFDACLQNPGAPGCLQKLPPVSLCKLTPSAEGCAQVLQLTFQSCLTNPHDASCDGILPTLGECSLTPSKNGCDAVLPTLNQCIGSPSLQGCGTRLPTLAQCAASPALAGCEAVLPTASFCGVHPGDASCVIFSGSDGNGKDAAGAPVAQALQGTVHLINTGTSSVAPPASQPAGAQPDDGKGKAGGERLAGPAQGQQTGMKNEKPATKNYCN